MPDETATTVVTPTPTVPDHTAAVTTMDKLIDQYLQRDDVEGDRDLDRPLSMLTSQPTAEAKVPPAPKAPTPTPSPTVDIKHPGKLLDVARKMGFDEAEIKATPTTDLWEAVFNYQKLAINARPPSPAHPVQTVVPAAPKELGLAWGDDADQYIDPSVRSVIEKAFTPLLDELRELRAIKGEFGSVKQFVQSQAVEQEGNAIDRAFTSLGAGYESIFGKGTRLDFAADSAEWQRRNAAVQLARGMKGDFARNLKAVAANLYGSFVSAETPAPAPQGRPRGPDGKFLVAEPDAVEQAWEAAKLGRPTNRLTPAEPQGPGAAARAIADMMMANGRPVNGSVQLSDFPE